jgi:hypothetical protein
VAEWYEWVVADTGAPVHEIRLKKTDGGWMLLLKARSATRGALVVIVGGKTIEDCHNTLAYAMTHEPGVKWKPDRYA